MNDGKRDTTNKKKGNALFANQNEESDDGESQSYGSESEMQDDDEEQIEAKNKLQDSMQFYESGKLGKFAFFINCS